MNYIVINDIYKHYKGNFYKVLYLAKHSEISEILVIYMALYENQEIWARPLSMWNEIVDFNEKKVKRFELIKG